MTSIRFNFNDAKAIEALVWLANEQPGISFYYVVKILFFADKMHLNQYGRPILGDRYIAMEHGPVPSVVYDMLGRDKFLEPELIKGIEDGISFGDGRHPSIFPREGRQFNSRLFSRTDIECLTKSLDTYGHMPISRLRAITHQEPAYQAASLNGEMDYALMIDADEENREKIADAISETAHAVVI